MTREPLKPRSELASRIWKIAKLLLAGGVILVLVLALAGVVYQSVTSSRDRRRFPAPGRMVTVSGVRLHTQIQGDGAPTVVFDSPVGASSLGWALVQTEVAKFTTTFAFDRAGYGWSDPGPTPRTCGRIVTELHELLDKSQVPRPYVLVGASFGACDLRLFAFRHPAEVAGIVLVDPTHEDQFIRAPSTKQTTGPLRVFQVASRLGILRLAGMPVDIAGMNVLPPDQQSMAVAVGYQTTAVDAIVAETAAVDEGFAEVREARLAAGDTPLGERPMIVLTRREETPPVGEEAALYSIWVDLHRELAAESTRGRQQFVDKSGHFIAVDQPSKVIDAIREVVELVKHGPH